MGSCKMYLEIEKTKTTCKAPLRVANVCEAGNACNVGKVGNAHNVGKAGNVRQVMPVMSECE